VSVNHYDTLNEYMTNAKAKITSNENIHEITPEQIKKAGINVLYFKN